MTRRAHNEAIRPGADGPALRAPVARQFLRACFLLLVLGCCSVHAQISKENQIKAVLLFRLSQFVEWPTNRFNTPESPVVIGVLGKNPFGDALGVAVRGETAQNRPIEIRPLRRDADSRACHILFICQSEAPRVRQITSSLAGVSTLTVSDMEGFVTSGAGMVRFKTEQNKVNLQINADAVKSAGLVVNSRLLRMAEIVKAP